MGSTRDDALQMVAAMTGMRETQTAKRNRRKAERVAREKAACDAQEASRDPRNMTQLEHRLKHNAHDISGEMAGGLSTIKIRHVLRIDELLADGILNDMQHLFGKQIITLWTVAQCPLMGAMNFGSGGREVDAVAGLSEDINLTRMDGTAQYYKTMLYLAFPRIDAMREAGRAYFEARRANNASGMREAQKKMRYIYAGRRKEHDLIVKICFEEKGCIDAAREVGIGINSATGKVRDAFDRLGDSLAKMRAVRKEIDEAAARACEVKSKFPMPNAAENISPA